VMTIQYNTIRLLTHPRHKWSKGDERSMKQHMRHWCDKLQGYAFIRCFNHSWTLLLSQNLLSIRPILMKFLIKCLLNWMIGLNFFIMLNLHYFVCIYNYVYCADCWMIFERTTITRFTIKYKNDKNNNGNNGLINSLKKLPLCTRC